MSDQLANLDLGDKVVIITGGGRGLGQSHALELAKRGALVVVNDVEIPEDTCRLITEARGKCIGNCDDITTEAGAKALVDAAIKAFDGLHIVVNNAGIIRDGAFHSMEEIGQNLVDIVNVHQLGTFWVSHAAFVHMRKQGYGRIINTTSASGLFGNFGQTNYGMAKAGIAGFTRALAHEGANKGIKVNAIAPVALTSMTAHLGALGKEFDPSAISAVVAYLSSEDCQLNGSILSCGGGHVAMVFTGVTLGITKLGLTAEDVAANIDTIRERDGYIVPGSMMDEVGITMEAIKAFMSDRPETLEEARDGEGMGTLTEEYGTRPPATVGG